MKTILLGAGLLEARTFWKRQEARLLEARTFWKRQEARSVITILCHKRTEAFLEEDREQNSEFARRRDFENMKPKGLQNLFSVICNASVLFMRNSHGEEILIDCGDYHIVP